MSDAPDRRQRVRTSAGAVLLGGAVAGTAVLTAIRLSSLQELHGLLLGVAAASDALFVALWLAGLIGAWLLRRRTSPPGWVRWAAAFLPALVLLQVWWPSLAGVVRPEDPPPGRSLRVVAQNLWHRNAEPEDAIERVLDQDADVVVLTEIDDANLRALRRSGAFEEYPHRVVRRRDDTQGMVLMSRHPLRADRRQPELFRLVARVEPPGTRPVTVVGVHLPAPQRSGAIPFWRRELRAVARDAERGGSAVVVAGDFNADDGHVAFRSMVDDAELRSAQDHAGGGPGATWPAAWRPVPPLLRLDHVLVGEAVGIEDFGFLPRLGADHLGVRADLVLRPR